MKYLDHKQRVANDLNHCNVARDNDWPYASATYLGAVIEAAECGIFVLADNQHSDVMALTNYIIDRKTEIELMWSNKLRQLQRIVSYGGAMEYEEIVLILSLRSGLESVRRFVKHNPRPDLDAVDKLLFDVLRENQDHVAWLEERGTSGLEGILPTHWWWRGMSPVSNEEINAQLRELE